MHLDLKILLKPPSNCCANLNFSILNWKFLRVNFQFCMKFKLKHKSKVAFTVIGTKQNIPLNLVFFFIIIIITVVIIVNVISGTKMISKSYFRILFNADDLASYAPLWQFLRYFVKNKSGPKKLASALTFGRSRYCLLCYVFQRLPCLLEFDY